MDKAIFVQNVKAFCKMRGVKPTIACRESGAGASLISQIETRGSIPSVEKVQLLAQYLGVSTSELLGEDFSLSGPPQPYLVHCYNSFPPEIQREVMSFVEFKVRQQEEQKAAEKKKHQSKEDS